MPIQHTESLSGFKKVHLRQWANRLEQMSHTLSLSSHRRAQCEVQALLIRHELNRRGKAGKKSQNLRQIEPNMPIDIDGQTYNICPIEQLAPLLQLLNGH